MLVYVICYGAAMLFAFSAHFTLSGMSLMFAALYLYLWEYGKSGNPLHLRGLFSLFYVGGEGISCLKLSNLQKDWSLETWACFFVAFAAFWNVYALAEKKFGYEKEKKTIDGFSLKFTGETLERYGTRIFIALTGLTILSLTAFLFEAFRLGYVPFLLRGVPHAYSYFHISGVHYVTVSCVLVPSMEVLLWFYDREMGKAKRIVSLIMTGIALLIPVLCVSRFQLIFAVILAVLTFMIVSGYRKIRYLFMAAVGLVPLYDEARRDRKLLLTKRELRRLEEDSKQPGFTIVPTLIFIDNHGRAKVDIALCKGKKEYDKRQTLKEKEDRREMDRAIKHF